jgi:hypothetical protein
MSTIVEKSLAVLESNLGRCPRCMQTSFYVALDAWVLMLAVLLTIHDATTRRVATTAAIAFTGLWVAHLVAYAARAATTSDKADDLSAEATTVWSRRQIASMFVRTLGAAAAGTALPATVFTVLLGTGGTAKCDEFGCDGNLCDTNHPCNRGCQCVYPEQGKMGYCQVWYRR